ncbi:MAG: hypothetical protein ACI8TQ_002100, partial [Planctomycetota bacterium]
MNGLIVSGFPQRAANLTELRQGPYGAAPKTGIRSQTPLQTFALTWYRTK